MMSKECAISAKVVDSDDEPERLMQEWHRLRAALGGVQKAIYHLPGDYHRYWQIEREWQGLGQFHYWVYSGGVGTSWLRNDCSQFMTHSEMWQDRERFMFPTMEAAYKALLAAVPELMEAKGL